MALDGGGITHPAPPLQQRNLKVRLQTAFSPGSGYLPSYQMRQIRPFWVSVRYSEPSGPVARPMGR